MKALAWLAEKKVISIKDKGLGMTAEEVEKYINQVAFSGAEEFMEKFKDSKDANEIIGRFGLGFYSAFMVADSVEIQTLSYQEGAEPARWVPAILLPASRVSFAGQFPTRGGGHGLKDNFHRPPSSGCASDRPPDT